MAKSVIFLIFVFLFAFNYGKSAKILGFFPAPTASHFVMFQKLMLALAERGHEVDVVSHFPQKNKVKNYNDISLLGTLPISVNNITLDVVEKWSQPHLLFDAIVVDFGYDLCKNILNTKVAKDLKASNKKYDLFITEICGTDCFLSFAHHFKIPSIGMISSISFPWAYDRVGLPDNPSYITHYFSPYTDDMSLYNRIINTISLAASKYKYQIVSVSKSDPYVKDFFGEDFPNINTLIKNMSLVLVNSHFSVNFAKATVPNFVEVGGLHVGVPKELPKVIQEVIKSDSIIFLSMGSMVKTETFSSTTLQAMFDTFAELQNYQVFWKANKTEFDKSLKIPKNIYFQNWMPQLDVLCHPKTKLFISHGGLMGSQEAVYCGVPRLGIPLFADQHLNIKSSELAGIAIKLEFKEITKNTFSTAIRKLLNESEGYMSRCQKTAQIFKDRPHTPLDTAIYWVEYVIRHNGAPHLRTRGADLPWYKYHLLDVAAIFIIILLILLYIIYIIISICLKKFCKTNTKTTSSFSKKEK